jgi:hypothetical protein
MRHKLIAAVLSGVILAIVALEFVANETDKMFIESINKAKKWEFMGFDNDNSTRVYYNHEERKLKYVE